MASFYFTEITISGVQGYQLNQVTPELNTSINVPSTYNDKNVLKIKEGAFLNCTTVTKIVIPNTVVSIELGALSNCSSLENVTIPFIGDGSTTNQYPFGFIFGTSRYTGGMKTIQQYKQGGDIVQATFYIPSTLKSVVIMSGPIPYGAFDNCNNLTSITIPASVVSIGGLAFRGCNSLKSVYYTGDIASWCGITFSSSTSNPLYYAHNLYINNELVKDIVIPDTVTEIKARAFWAWNGTSITIPNSVTSIGDYAFCGCHSLTSLTIPNSVTSISNGTFLNCSSLTSITIGNSITSIGTQAFAECSNLKIIYYQGNKVNFEIIDKGWEWISSSFSNSLFIRCTDMVIKLDGTEIPVEHMHDFKNFTFKGERASDYGLIRVSTGKRYNENINATLKDTTISVPGSDGTLWLDSQHTQRQFKIDFAFDEITELQLRQIKKWLNGKDAGQLIFDEQPYKAYNVKVTQVSTIKHLCFMDKKNQRVYKGEGSVTFTAFDPYAYSTGLYWNDFVAYDNLNEWFDSVDIPDQFDATIGYVNLGDLPATFTLACNSQLSSTNTLEIKLNGERKAKIEFNLPEGYNNELKWDSKLGLVYLKNSGNNKYELIRATGDLLFKLQPTEKTNGYKIFLNDNDITQTASLTYNYRFY